MGTQLQIANISVESILDSISLASIEPAVKNDGFENHIQSESMIMIAFD